MSHIEQVEFCKKVKDLHPYHFKSKKVLDCGSLDINGNNRYLFEDCDYTGIDIAEGRNVDEVYKIHEYDKPDEYFDIIISTECFEHDMYYTDSIRNIYRMLKHGGMFVFTCASTNRPEHGTIRSEPNSSPLTASIEGWGSYYKNLDIKDIIDVIDIDVAFSDFKISVDRNGQDLNFWGIKR